LTSVRTTSFTTPTEETTMDFLIYGLGRWHIGSE
jgi:hypothetical protein